MPYFKGTATSFDDLVSKIVTWATDTDIHGDDAWEVMRNDPWPRGTIFKAKGMQGEDHCYIGLMCLNMQVGKTYRDWLLSPENVGKYIVWSANALNRPGSSFMMIGDTIEIYNDRYDHTDGTRAYAVSNPEIIISDCKILVFGVFKQYSDDLDWSEQPGSVVFPNDVGLIQLSVGGIGVKPPLYPGLGYPGIGMSYAEPTDGFFNFWVTKDSSHITVIVKNKQYWDVGHAGMLIPYQSNIQYPFPAVMASSCSGLVGAISGNTIGAKFDYSYSNWMLSRGMPAFPTTLKDSSTTISQVCLCLPDGTWQFFSNWLQQITGEGTIKKPVRPTNMNYYIKPTCIDLAGLVQVYPTIDTYQLEPLDFIQNTTDCSNILGRMRNIFWPSQKIYIYGETMVNGKLHLIIPNNWEDRPWYIYPQNTAIINAGQLLQMQQEITRYSNQMNIMIRLED